MARFDKVACRLEDRRGGLERYIEGHRRWMKGAYDWQLASCRYARAVTADAHRATA